MSDMSEMSFQKIGMKKDGNEELKLFFYEMIQPKLDLLEKRISHLERTQEELVSLLFDRPKRSRIDQLYERLEREPHDRQNQRQNERPWKKSGKDQDKKTEQEKGKDDNKVIS